MHSEKNYLMIGNTRWHWAKKLEADWKFFHTSPNPIEFKNKDYSQIAWASVGRIPEDIKLCTSKQINLEDIPLINPAEENLGFRAKFRKLMQTKIF